MHRSDFDALSLGGLSEEEASARLAQQGPNELPSSRTRSLWHLAFEVVREPMFLLLLGCGALYLLLGDITEALVLLGFVFVMIGIELSQERKTERALEALRDLSSPRALVVRGGVARRVAGREVVRGDVVILAEGDRVPADARVEWNVNLSCDESLLTGESVPVRKRVARESDGAFQPGGDDIPFVYSGSLVVQGHAAARVVETGLGTELGKIGKALASVETEQAPLAREVDRIVRRLAVVGLLLCVLVAVVYGVTRHDAVRGLLAGITLAMAMLPEEFPVVLTVFLALGAWRLSQRRVLARRSAAVETLGSASVLCVDKTGTLTQNRMSIAELWSAGVSFAETPGGELPEPFHGVAEYAILASQRDPFDPMEVAIKEFGVRHLAGTEHLHEGWIMVREYPLSPKLLALSHVWVSPDQRGSVIAAKGAPEAVADLCHLSEAETASLGAVVDSMAARGLRVLAVAQTRFSQGALPEEQHDFPFALVGLVGLADPIRPGVPVAVRECYDAGIRLVMMTGDYPATARSIARQIGLRNPDEVITGPELAAMTPEQLRARMATANLFARVVPDQKLALVRALQDRAIVAMTGDGVNDAPALKAAHIGIAMGGRGTDVAREASALVLLDDDFGSIVGAVRLGRRIFDNIRKAMAYILAIHVPIAGMSLLPVLFGWPIVLFPVHIVFLELIIDPACSIVFEAEAAEPGVMARPPRDPSAALFSGRTVLISVLQGLVVLGVVLATLVLAQGRGEKAARALAFATLISANVALILTNRSWERNLVSTLLVPNRALWWVVGGAFVFLALALMAPPGRHLFLFDELRPLEMVQAVVVGGASVLWFEVWKIFRRTAGASSGG
ncbi:MAG: cation-translocating P-type ATPase [Myxococcales bacterium]